MGLGETKCPAIVAPENRHALPSRFLLTGRRPVCSRRLRRRSHGMRDLWSRTIRMVRGTDGPALTLTPNGVRSSTGRRKRLPSSRSFRLLTAASRPFERYSRPAVPHYSRRPRAVSSTGLTLVRPVCSRIASLSVCSRVFDPFAWFAGPPVPRYSLSRRSLRLRAALPREWSARPEVSH